MHDLAGMADEADGTTVLTSRKVVFLWKRCDERLFLLLRSFLPLPYLLACRRQVCSCCLASFAKQLRGNVVHSWRLSALRLRTASSTSSLSTGKLLACCVGVWLLVSRLVEFVVV